MQEYNLDPSILSDDAGEENLEKLVNVGENLLEQIVKKVNTTSFVPYEEPNEGTNAEALKRYVHFNISMLFCFFHFWMS